MLLLIYEDSLLSVFPVFPRQPAAVRHTAHVDHVIRHEAPATDTAASNKKVSPDDTAGQNVSSSEDNNLFFYGNIRSGQTLEVKKSIIIIGNVEKRATVISAVRLIQSHRRMYCGEFRK